MMAFGVSSVGWKRATSSALYECLAVGIVVTVIEMIAGRMMCAARMDDW
jgi:hypothetical protein